MSIDDVFSDIESDTPVARCRISSVPSKSQIWIWAIDNENDKEDGFDDPRVSDIDTGFLTPAIVPVYIGNGTRHFRLRKEGYEDAILTVSVEDRRTTNIDKQLFKLGTGPFDGTLKVTSSPSHSNIQIWKKKEGDYEPYKPDNRYVTPQNFNLLEGIYRVTITRAGHRPITFDEISLKKGSTIEKQAILEMLSEKGEELRIF